MGRIKSYTSSSGMKTVHYDENGNKIGETWQSASGGKATHYDASGNKTGVSYKSPGGHVTHYDPSGGRTGHSYIHSSHQIKHYDTNYNKTGEMWGSGFGHTTQSEQSTSHSSSSVPSTGCATLLFLAGDLFTAHKHIDLKKERSPAKRPFVCRNLL